LAHVVDGDTIHVRSSRGLEKIRIGQVDAPERSQSFGVEATTCLRNAVTGRELVVCRDGSDRYGRTVANVTSGGADVGSTLVAQGCAWVYYKYLEADSSLPALEQSARQARLGLWAGQAIAPWVYRSGGSPVTIIPSTGLLPITVQASNQASAHNRVFDWAEHRYPELLTGGSLNQTLSDGTIYRCYATGFCIGYRSGKFLTYDGTAIREAGTESDFIRQAEAEGF
jgi:hypothetical protein